MKFALLIECDNDAFYGDAIESEVVRILETLRFDMNQGDADKKTRINLRDINGNTVGYAEFTGKRIT